MAPIKPKPEKIGEVAATPAKVEVHDGRHLLAELRLFAAQHPEGALLLGAVAAWMEKRL